MAKEHAMIESGRRQSLGKRIWKNRWVYLFLLPGIAFVLLFCYGPMYGLVVAFNDCKISKGILVEENICLLPNIALLLR